MKINRYYFFEASDFFKLMSVYIWKEFPTAPVSNSGLSSRFVKGVTPTIDTFLR